MALLRKISRIGNNLKIADLGNRLDCLYYILYPVSGKREDVYTIFLKVIKIYLERPFSKNLYLMDTSISYNQYDQLMVRIFSKR